MIQLYIFKRSESLQALFRIQPLHVVRKSFWLIKILTTPSFIIIIPSYFTLPICFYLSQDTSRSLSPSRRLDNPHSSRTWDKIFEGGAEDYHWKRRWKMVTVLSTASRGFHSRPPSSPLCNHVIFGYPPRFVRANNEKICFAKNSASWFPDWFLIFKFQIV